LQQKGGKKMQKTKNFTIRLSEEEYSWLQEYSQKHNVPISDFFNRCLAKKRLGFIGYLKLKLKRLL
jgi:hypothetical protein